MAILSCCPNCFNDTNSNVCSNCGYDLNNVYAQDPSALMPTTMLNRRYLLGRLLGRGGFGITYVAKDLMFGKIVAIKEYMPESYAHRVGGMQVVPTSDENEYAYEYCKKNFEEEAEVLKSLLPNRFVVDYYDFFSENNTSYIVMEFVDGVTLKTLTNRSSDRISCSEAIHATLTIGSVLMEVHREGIIHRDISPENIMMTVEGDIKLIDFGAATNYLYRNTMSNESIFLKPGFTPPEQYSSQTRQGPWTDMYALAATFYTSVTSNPLVPADKRRENDTLIPLKYLNCGVPDFVSDAIEKAMNLDYEYRFPAINQFLDAIAPVLQSSSVEIAPSTISLIRKKRQLVEESHFQPYLIVTNGSNSGKCIPLNDKDYISLGRERNNDLVIDNSFAGEVDLVGRYHCTVRYDSYNKKFIIRDNQSSNGTFLSNSIRLPANEDYAVNPGTSFYLCERALMFSVKLM